MNTDATYENNQTIDAVAKDLGRSQDSYALKGRAIGPRRSPVHGRKLLSLLGRAACARTHGENAGYKVRDGFAFGADLQ